MGVGLVVNWIQKESVQQEKEEIKNSMQVTQNSFNIKATVKEIKIENVDDEMEREEQLELLNEDGEQRLPTVAYSKILSKIQNKVENYWPIAQSDMIREKFDKMNGCKRFFAIWAISEKNLFVVSGSLDTYCYMLYLRNVTLLVCLLLVLNGGILFPLFYMGTTAEECFNSTANEDALVYLSQTMYFGIGNAIINEAYYYASFGLSVLNMVIVIVFAVRLKKKIDFAASSTTDEHDEKDAQEFYVSRHTIQFQNLPRKNKFYKT